jgi:hypothetical protein
MSPWIDPAFRQLFADRACPEYDDPVQGANPNCSLIAGISACAWVGAGVPGILQGNVKDGYNHYTDSVSFYNGSGGLLPVQYFYETIWNPAANCCHSDEQELWPALIEKAFAKYFTPGSGAPATEIPDMTKATWKNFSLDPLLSLTVMHTTAVPPMPATPNDFFAMMQPQYLYPVAGNQTGDGTQTSYQTKFPFIAISRNNSHTYTILGAVKTGGQTYIIVRDPRKGNAVAPPVRLLGGVWQVKKTNFTPLGNPNPVPIAWMNIPLGVNGVFGIDNRDFMQYFGTYGYVKG